METNSQKQNTYWDEWMFRSQKNVRNYNNTKVSKTEIKKKDQNQLSIYVCLIWEKMKKYSEKFINQKSFLRVSKTLEFGAR